MTALGLIFAVAYLIGFATKGRVGLLAVAAAAIPFNDSAAVVTGVISFSPFYLGMLFYLPLAYLRIGVPRPGSSLPVALGLWAIAVTLVGPSLFDQMPVVASGVGIDQQVNRLSQLSYTTSNVAQVGYLVLNLALLMALANSEDIKKWIPLVPAVLGTSVATLAWWLREMGLPWPDEFFRNNTPNAYAYVETPRLTAQFSEASHLGAFALTSGVLLAAVLLFQRPPPVAKLILLVMVAADVLLVIESGSATALAGAGIFGIIAASWAGYRVAVKGIRIPVAMMLVGLVSIGIIFALLPDMISYVRDVIEYKLDRGTSIRSRTSADINSWRIFLDTGTLGVGLGSNRSSSLFLLLLSTIGLVGTILFLMIMGRAIRDGLRDRNKLACAAGLTVLLAAAFSSLADLVSPMMWLLAAFCWNAGPRESTHLDRVDPAHLANVLDGPRGGFMKGLQAVTPKP